MKKDRLPPEHPFDVHRVGLILDDIDGRGDRGQLALLADFMCVAWPSPEARSQ